eukprot:4466654-Prymnesium_polylepis.1
MHASSRRDFPAVHWSARPLQLLRMSNTHTQRAAAAQASVPDGPGLLEKPRPHRKDSKMSPVSELTQKSVPKAALT